VVEKEKEMRKFDFYEFTGVLAPGTVILLGISLIFPSFKGAIVQNSFSIGDFGIFLILAYIAGHLIQSVGNLIEFLWWEINCGLPTDWVRSDNSKILSKLQKDILRKKIREMLGIEKIKDLNKNDWFNITRQIYSLVCSKGRASRVDIFNGNYGLCRGLAGSFLVILILDLAFSGLLHWKIDILVLFAFVLSIYRMHRFAKHYVRELFIQFLQFSNKSKTGGL